MARRSCTRDDGSTRQEHQEVARARAGPNSGRRRGPRSGELEPPQPLPFAQMDAGDSQLRVAALRRPFGRRRRNSDPLRRLGLHRRRAAGVLASADQGFDLPWVHDRWARPLLTLVKLITTFS